MSATPNSLTACNKEDMIHNFPSLIICIIIVARVTLGICLPEIIIYYLT